MPQKAEIGPSLSEKYLWIVEEKSKGINMVSEKLIGKWKIDPGVPIYS